MLNTVQLYLRQIILVTVEITIFWGGSKILLLQHRCQMRVFIFVHQCSLGMAFLFQLLGPFHSQKE